MSFWSTNAYQICRNLFLSQRFSYLQGPCSSPDMALAILKGQIDGKAAAGHSHTKGQITDFPASMPASDVSAWAKAASKPGYTAAEVGAAAASHGHGAENIVSGTLPVVRGGTGVTSVGGTDYTTVRFRGSGLRSSDTNPTTNGTINWTYG